MNLTVLTATFHSVASSPPKKHFSIALNLSLMNGSLSLKLIKLRNFSLLNTSCSYPINHLKEDNLNYPLTSLQCGTILQSLTNTKTLSKGQLLHAHMIVSNTLHENSYLKTKLAAFYASCGQMDQAQIVFDGIVLKNSFLWNFMIRGYACNGFPMKALDLYRKMLSFGQKADNFSYPFILKACGNLTLDEIGRRVHCEVVVCGLESNIYVCNSLVSMYSKFGKMEIARKVFDRMCERDLTSWNSIISGYVKNGYPLRALELFDLMKKFGQVVDSTTLLGVLSAFGDLKALKEGKGVHGYVIQRNVASCNNYLTNAILEMYCNCNSMVYARRTFEEMTLKDIVTWNSLISGYTLNGDAFESFRLFSRMGLEGVQPDQVTLVAVLVACNEITALHFGASVHSFIVKTGFGASAAVGTALVDMYSKCGFLTFARFVFDEMLGKNLISWSAMIAAYGLHGKGQEAVSLFHEMKAKHIIPDEGTFTSVLSACSHAGLVDEGNEIFNRMIKEYNVRPEIAHYSCLVDLLGRAGHLDEAYRIIKSMEVKPTSDIWAALLSACRLHQNVELAKISAQALIDTKPSRVSTYVSLSNIYAAEKRWDEVEKVRAIVSREGLQKPPGCSFIEFDKMVHHVLVADRSHPQT